MSASRTSASLLTAADPLGDWVLREVYRQARAWAEMGL
jgi:hypothetical protein